MIFDRRRYFTVAALATTMIVAPAACARQKQAPDAAAPSAEGKSAVSFLPHPAFAHAKGKDGAVTIADVAARALPSVVNISATKVTQVRGPSPFFEDPFFRHFFGPGEVPKERREQGLGSGVIVSKDGLVLTNAHVVDKAEDIQVLLPDKRVFEVEVIGSDPKSDLALVKLKGDAKGLQPIEFADSSRLRLGDVVLAIGNPFGLSQTVTMGIVSATGRANVGITDYEDFIQTDAAINPGNSGGALVDMEGRLVGINTAILSRSGGYQGIGFAIPSNMVKPIMESLLKHGKVVRGFLGVIIQDLDQELAQALGLKSASGVLISDVTQGGPADKAGLKRGDVVLSVNGKATNSTGRLRNLIAASGAGANTKLEIIRDGKTQTITVKLGELPTDAEAERSSAAPRAEEPAGLSIAPLTPEIRARLKLDHSIKNGVVVTKVNPGSAAARSGLRSGDVILEANRKPVKTVGDLRGTLMKTKGTVLLLVHRQGRTLYLTLESDQG